MVANDRVIYEYRVSVARRGTTMLVIGVLLIAAWLLLDLSQVESGAPTFFFVVIEYLMLLVGIIFVVRGAVLRRDRGEWHILLTSTRLTWSSPPPTGRLGFEGDDSFDVALADIREVMCDDGRSAQLDTLHGRWCRIRMHDGTEYQVGTESGVNLLELARNLEEAGVRIRHA